MFKSFCCGREMPRLPEDGGIMLKLGSTTGKPKVREFHFEKSSNGKKAIVYTSRKIWGKESGQLELSTFFVRKVRQATEEEIKLVLAYSNANTVFKIAARRCFDVDFYDPKFPLAVGPAMNRSVTIFAVPDQTLADLWGFFAEQMIEEGIFQASSEDPDIAVVIGVAKECKVRRFSSSDFMDREKSDEVEVNVTGSVLIAPKATDAKPVHVERRAKYNKANADALLNSLPLPPATELEFIHDDD